MQSRFGLYFSTYIRCAKDVRDTMRNTEHCSRLEVKETHSVCPGRTVDPAQKRLLKHGRIF